MAVAKGDAEARQLVDQLRSHRIEPGNQDEELRRVQLELEVSRARYLEFYDNAPIGYFTISEHGLILEANLTAGVLLGLARDALIKLPFTKYIVSEDQDAFYLPLKQLFSTGTSKVCELRMKKGDGTQFWANLEIASPQPGVSACLAVMSDITERKQMCVLNELLLSSLPHPAMLIRKHDRVVLAANKIAQEVGVKVGGYCWRDFGKMDYLSDPHREIAEKFPETVPAELGIKCTFCQGDECSLTDPMQNDSEVKAFGKIWDTYWINIDGSIYLHYAIDVTARKAMEETLKTGRKLAEQALIEKEIDLDESQQIAKIGTWTYYPALRQSKWSKEMFHIWGMDPRVDPLIYSDIGKCIHPDDYQHFDSTVRMAIERGISYEIEYRIRRPDGSERAIRTIGEPQADASGKVIALRGINQDITERKKQEQQYEVIVRGSMDGFWQADVQGNITDVNDSFCDTIGYSRGELLKMKVSDIEFNEDPEEIAAHGRRIREVGYDRFETRYKHKDGSIVDFEISVNYLKSVDRFFVFARNISERKQSENQIIRSLREKEVLLKEIYHRVKNNLAVIQSLLSLQSMSIADSKIRALFEESRNQINSMALVHAKLYRSADLAHIDFKDYLQSLVADIADAYNRPNVVLSVAMTSLYLDVNVGIPCGLIVNELISNSIKYAFPAGEKGTITVGISKNSAGHNVLSVADNGVGFPENIDFRDSLSIGLQIVNVLVRQINGTLELSRSNGTRFSIIFPS
ncbi:MAG: PAS domain S-box protein [Candidatus Riflebacteria bacterium]|nr:PAS domain S-box protein [Candidatus Riflebacteria bacterium]